MHVLQVLGEFFWDCNVLISNTSPCAIDQQRVSDAIASGVEQMWSRTRLLCEASVVQHDVLWIYVRFFVNDDLAVSTDGCLSIADHGIVSLPIQLVLHVRHCIVRDDWFAKHNSTEQQTRQRAIQASILIGLCRLFSKVNTAAEHLAFIATGEAEVESFLLYCHRCFWPCAVKQVHFVHIRIERG